jgi:hypothetical protein
MSPGAIIDLMWRNKSLALPGIKPQLLEGPSHSLVAIPDSYLIISMAVGMVSTVLGYRSEGPGLIPGTTRKKSSGSGTGCTQPREYN